MNKAALLTGAVCFLAGFGCCFLTVSKPPRVTASQTHLTSFTSQGRSELKAMISGINAVLDNSEAEIIAEQTRMLQAVTAQKPDRNAADFYLSGLEEKRSKAQTDVDRLLLDAIEKMPLIDKQTYMKLYRKNRFSQKSPVILPLTATENDK